MEQEIKTSDQHPPATPCAQENGSEKTKSTLAQTFSMVASLLVATVRFLASFITKGARFAAQKLDDFSERNCDSTQRLHHVLKKPACGISHFLKKYKFTDLQRTSTAIQSIVVCTFLICGYLLLNAVFSPAPPAKIIQAAVARDVGSTASFGGGVTQNDLTKFGLGNKLIKYKLTNHYTRKIDGEKFHIYDYVAEVKTVAGPDIQEGTVYIIKRGSGWYCTGE